MPYIQFLSNQNDLIVFVIANGSNLKSTGVGMTIYAIVKKLCPLSCLAIKKFHSDVFTTSDTNKDSVNRQLKKIGYMYIQAVPKTTTITETMVNTMGNQSTLKLNHRKLVGILY